jgi:hypothetical protein
MTSIDFKQKLAAAIANVFPGDRIVLPELFEQDVDLTNLFDELKEAADECGTAVAIGTVNELRALLLSDPYMAHGSLTPIGPSLRISWHGKLKKFCLGVDSDCDLEGGDGKKLRLLSWSGQWPDCSFDEDRGVGSIEEFFDELVEEIAAIQHEAQTVARIYEERDHRSLQTTPPGSTSFWDRAACVCLLAAILLSTYASNGEVFVTGAFMAGILLFWTGLLNLKWASETLGVAPKYSDGLWRVAVGAGLTAIPAINGMLVSSFPLSPIDCDIISACSGF